MTAEKETKLNYLELLNDIASGERRAGVHLQGLGRQNDGP